MLCRWRQYIFMFWYLIASNPVWALVDSSATSETTSFYQKLQSAAGRFIYFGQHENDTYISDSQSEIKNITGSMPYLLEKTYVMGWSTAQDTIDRNNIAKTVLQTHYNNGGIVGVVFNIMNFTTGGGSMEKTGTEVADMLPGGSQRTTYLTYLDAFATWMKSLTDKNGNLIPVLVRPFHEADGYWMYWGYTNCTDAQFIALWQDFISRMISNDVHNAIYVYAPEVIFGYSYDGARYPGDNYVDVFGIDGYCNSDLDVTCVMDGYASILSRWQAASDAAFLHNKPFAITEGLRNQTAAYRSDYWTWLMPQIVNDEKVSLASYVLIWTSPTYGPLESRGDATDFEQMKINHRNKVLFLGDSDSGTFRASGLTLSGEKIE